MPPYNKVLIVGHCGADTSSLTWLVGQVAPKAPAYYVGSDSALKKHIDGSALVLINRVLEGSFEADDGLGLIRQLKQQGADAGLMLISNYSDAQASARALGALDGFGKSSLSSSAVKAKLTELLSE